jgi:hypothetical protein
VEIKNGDQISGVRVMVSYGNATVHGVVKLENGTLPAGARIFVRVSRPGENGPPTIRPPQVDARGHFIMEGLPAGTYDFTAVIANPIPGPLPPGTPPPRPVSGKQQASVSDGVVNDVTITVDLSEKPGPPTP